ncbi:Visual pigment-like receptor peropsin [Nymphon striatum]|nr:Visual pigment-like receptor peropsin [Nymphon striatum]
MSIKKFKVLFTPANLLLMNLAVGDVLMVISQNPFSGISAMMNRWLFGEVGCQVYGFMGFLSGTVMIGSMTVIAVYRYHVTKWSYENVNLTFKKTAVILAGVWIYAFFWSLMPLLGWARYDLEPSLTACTIDWRNNDVSYKTFLVTYCTFGFIIPFSIQIICYYEASNILKRTDPRNNRNSIEDHKVKPAFVWALHSSANKMGIALVSSFLIAWTPYAILCMWTVIDVPDTVPFFLTLIPPIFAKSFTFINPLVFYCSHPRLRRAMKLTVTKCCQDYPLDLPVDLEDV